MSDQVKLSSALAKDDDRTGKKPLPFGVVDEVEVEE